MEVLNTTGAAIKLGCSTGWIQKLVRRGELRAYVFNEVGRLVIRAADDQRQGQGLYFLDSDLEGYEPEVLRRPRGGKNKTNI